jgi:hypothetical protein
LKKSILYHAPQYAFSILLSVPSRYILVFTLASCSQTSTIFVIPLRWETKFHMKTK